MNVPRYSGLRCFADPVEYYWGLSDVERSYFRDGKVIPEPHLCALCPARGGCGKVAWERVSTDPALLEMLEGWEAAAKPLTREARYEVAEWERFIIACRSRSWTNSNDVAHHNRKVREAAAAKMRRRRKRLVERRRRSVSVEAHETIKSEADHRFQLLLAMRRTKGALRAVEKRTIESCRRVADVWMARELLDRANIKVTGRAIAEWLIANGKVDGISVTGLTSRANEALRLIVQLEEAAGGRAPYWPELSY